MPILAVFFANEAPEGTGNEAIPNHSGASFVLPLALLLLLLVVVVLLHLLL